MLNGCVNLVHILGSVVEKVRRLHTIQYVAAVYGVHDTRVSAHQSAQFVRVAVHKICSPITPVTMHFIPGFHSTYNKQLRIT